MKFKLTVALNLSAYNHVLLEKNFTALSNSLFNTSKIEEFISSLRSFIACHIQDRQ